MNKNKLLFNKEYEDFYKMAEENEVFSKYCEEVHGIDFSQDGFSDKKQIDELLIVSGIKPEFKVLEIGCGNGKMAKYIAEKTGATVYGFDYSENAITYAKQHAKDNNKLIFDEGIIGEKAYPPQSFDVIISIDSMCYTLDIEGFVQQLYMWLKPNGLFITFYSEGQIKSKSKNEDSTDLALAFKHREIPYVTVDYTEKHYEFLKHKREVIMKQKDEFLQNNMEFYYRCALSTSIDENVSFEDFKKQFNRYLYIVRKEVDTQELNAEDQEEEAEMNISVKIAQNKEMNDNPHNRGVHDEEDEMLEQQIEQQTERNNGRANIGRANVSTVLGNNQPRRRLFNLRRF